MMARSALTVCPTPELGLGERRVVRASGLELLVLNCAGELFASRTAARTRTPR